MSFFNVDGEDFFRMFLLSFPLVMGGILHMVVVKMDILSYLKKPIHQSWFGNNKTWRGFVVMPLATWPGVLIAQFWERLAELSPPLIAQYPSLVLSIVLGIAYCLAELPNSYMKRRLGIKEGKTSEKNKWLFVIIDQADSVIGCLIAYYLYVKIDYKLFFGVLVLGTLIHLFFNVLLFVLKLRKNPF